jgi:ketoreductase RED2
MQNVILPVVRNLLYPSERWVGVSEQRVVIVTGSTSGIGLAVAERCLDLGWRTVLNSRSSADAGVALAKRHDNAIYVRGDAAVSTDCEQVVNAAVSTWGRIDALVNNAGTTEFIPHGDIEAATPDIWSRILDVNVVGTWRMITAALPHLRAAAPGRIVNVASVAGLRPVGSSIPYSVSKAALIHMTTLLGKALGPDVLVNAVAPGMIETPWTAHWSEARADIQASAPLHRTGLPAEVAVLCEQLLNATYTTGECVSIDGGVRLVR